MWKQILLIMILLIPAVSGATIQGTVYDLELNIVDNAIVSIDTQPKQQFVAVEGAYTLEVPKGEYTLIATQNGMKTAENISIIDDGEYTLDLFLFVDLTDDTEILETELGVDTDELIEGEISRSSYVWVIVLLGVLLIIAALVIFKKSKKEEVKTEQPEEVKDFLTDDAEKVMNIIKRHGGHTTQKAIRKDLGVSEAKVSLIVADLVDQGKIRKIKKGRANVIVINGSS